MGTLKIRGANCESAIIAQRKQTKTMEEEKIYVTRKKESVEVRLKRMEEAWEKGYRPRLPTEKERWEMYQRRWKKKAKTEE